MIGGQGTRDPVQRPARELRIRTRVGGQQIFPAPHSSTSLLIHTKAPGAAAEPPQILDRIPDMREFPIQNRRNSFGVDEQIAQTEVAMHERVPW